MLCRLEVISARAGFGPARRATTPARNNIRTEVVCWGITTKNEELVSVPVGMMLKESGFDLI
jgi:hypothetical protein